MKTEWLSPVLERHGFPFAAAAARASFAPMTPYLQRCWQVFEKSNRNRFVDINGDATYPAPLKLSKRSYP